MTKEQVIERVQKLLALARSDNPHEAASAAAKAQQLMDEHRLSTMMLQIEMEQEDEPLHNTQRHGGDPMDSGSSLPMWRLQLGGVIAKANGCSAYRWRSRISGRGSRPRTLVQLHVTGRRSDIECASYLYGYVWREIDRLCKRDTRGLGKGYANNYRLGAVAEIERRLKAQKARTEAQAREAAGANSRALMRVDGALARLDDRLTESRRWQDENLRLGKISSRSSYNYAARADGARAAKGIALGQARGALGQSAKRLRG